MNKTLLSVRRQVGKLKEIKDSIADKNRDTRMVDKVAAELHDLEEELDIVLRDQEHENARHGLYLIGGVVLSVALFIGWLLFWFGFSFQQILDLLF